MDCLANEAGQGEPRRPGRPIGGPAPDGRHHRKGRHAMQAFAGHNSSRLDGNRTGDVMAWKRARIFRC